MVHSHPMLTPGGTRTKDDGAQIIVSCHPPFFICKSQFRHGKNLKPQERLVRCKHCVFLPPSAQLDWRPRMMVQAAGKMVVLAQTAGCSWKGNSAGFTSSCANCEYKQAPISLFSFPFFSDFSSSAAKKKAAAPSSLLSSFPSDYTLTRLNQHAHASFAPSVHCLTNPTPNISPTCSYNPELGACGLSAHPRSRGKQLR